ncbi:hypothetical protein Cni_G12900 [Canna indica]|uniref:BHLH domain-containing protein n=1 Tax=Canna indica TaxID=4628 RepID=A0AAQ3K909_9LILI|nr:hypothetical protein Cni_G12900 [Canna indica]
MEKERFFCVSSQSPEAVMPVQINCGAATGQLPQPVLNLGWDQLMHHGVRFDSALGSLVPSSPSSNQLAGSDSVGLRELVGRLGSSGDMSLTSRYQNANSSHYSTLLSSPSKLGMDHQQQSKRSLPMAGQFAAPFSTNPGFVERAARFSCFGARSYDGLRGQFGLPEAGRLSRVSSSQSLKATGGIPVGVPDNGKETASTPEETEFSNGQEASSASDMMPASSAENNARKRKAATKGKGKAAPLSFSTISPPKETEEEIYEAKRCKTSETSEADKFTRTKPNTEQSSDDGQKQGKDNNAKPPEPPKDYIHVRARRGQATDSHSLAERVRREKISERMKLLQDLVPGCNKITGKALMLDEIINYVQSLQRQVEFLSTKLATLNPQLDCNMDSLLRKDMHQEGTLPQQVYPPLDLTSTAFSYAQQDMQTSLNPLDSLRQPPGVQLDSLEGFADANSQLGNFWEDDLQYVVQMGFGKSQGTAFSSQSLCAE